MENEKNKIAVAVAVYNNEDEVIEFAKGLLKQTIINQVQLLVTCNACKNVGAFKKKLSKVMPSALVFTPGSNLGYLNGCLYGVKKANVSYSWVMISNTDIKFNQYDFFEKALMNVDEDVWCVGPNIKLSTTGIHQNPFLIDRPSKRKILVWKWAYSNYLFFRIYFKLSDLKTKQAKSMKKNSRFVYAVHGSCFLLRNNCAGNIMKVCKEIFMYGEELLVAEVIFKNRKKCYFNSEISITHNENQVTGSIGMKRKQKWFKNSINYLINNFYKI